MENYELGENVLAARERIVFTDVIDAKNPVRETLSICPRRQAY
jgi:hypothetical protein